jgi:hypothetical protein
MLATTVNAGTVYLNGFPVGKDINYIDHEGFIYIPLRKLVEMFGGDLDWDGSTRTVTIYNPVSLKKEVLAEVIIDKKTAVLYPIDGSEPYTVEMEAPPVIIDSRTYLPYNFILESLGFEGDLDKNTGDIRLKGSF